MQVASVRDPEAQIMGLKPRRAADSLRSVYPRLFCSDMEIVNDTFVLFVQPG
jgi:hypothetical protein